MSRNSENLLISDNTEEVDVKNPLKCYVWLVRIGPKHYQTEFAVQMDQLWSHVLHSSSALFQQLELAETFKRTDKNAYISIPPVCTHTPKVCKQDLVPPDFNDNICIIV